MLALHHFAFLLPVPLLVMVNSQRLLEQEVGFYDQTKIGEVTSRLSTDTTKMADQISLNINVLLRSVITAIGVIYFMAAANYKLTILTVVSIPATVVITKVRHRV